MTDGGADGGTDGGVPFCDDRNTSFCQNAPSAEVQVLDGGAADFSCAPYASTPSTQEVDVSGKVRDYSTGNQQSSVTVAAFSGPDFSQQIATHTPAGPNYGLTLPTGTGDRTFWRLSRMAYLPTYALNLKLDLSQSSLTVDHRIVSSITLQGMATAVGEDPNAVLQGGSIQGSVYQCNGDQSLDPAERAKHTVAHAVAVLSSTSGKGHTGPTPVPNTKVFYFSGGALSTTARETDSSGQFVIFHVPPASDTRYYLQVWGFRTAADAAKGAEGLSLLSELQVPAFAGSYMMADLPPNGP